MDAAHGRARARRLRPLGGQYAQLAPRYDADACRRQHRGMSTRVDCGQVPRSARRRARRRSSSACISARSRSPACGDPRAGRQPAPMDAPWTDPTSRRTSRTPAVLTGGVTIDPDRAVPRPHCARPRRRRRSDSWPTARWAGGASVELFGRPRACRWARPCCPRRPARRRGSRQLERVGTAAGSGGDRASRDAPADVASSRRVHGRQARAFERAVAAHRSSGGRCSSRSGTTSAT